MNRFCCGSSRDPRKSIHGIALTLLWLVFCHPEANGFAIEDPDTTSAGFKNEVVPVFSKLGCNSGACHGAVAGKGGLRLSLHGYDPLSDFFNVARQARGRRIEPAAPERSLLLTKPTGIVPHKGGVRFEVDSPEYQLLKSWIESGAPPPRPDEISVQRIAVMPAANVVSQGQQFPVSVTAHFDDGTTRDVTRWARFSSTDESLARVDQEGNISVIGYGEGAITAWYSSKLAVARVTSPYDNEISSEVAKKTFRSKQDNFIDRLILNQLERLNILPSPLAEDEVFLRRAYLDTIGTLPTPQEVLEFTAQSSQHRKERLVNSLLERSEFVDYWTYQWSDLLLINGTKLRPKAVKAFYDWVRSRVEKNTPWDEFVREIITARGSSIENGATNFYALHQDPENMAENASQAFLGLSIGCAKCHNHPLEKWTNDQYYAFANLFSRVRAKGWGGDTRNGDGVRTLFLADAGELIQPIRGRPQPPTPLDGQAIPFDYQGDRRVPLAKWLTAPENPYFARAISNRIWARFFGVGLVESVDDMRITNPASNEKLLDAASKFLIERNYDLKQLMKQILLSNAYARSSTPLPENKVETRFYSRYYPRRLMAEVLLDAVSQVTDVPTKFNRIGFPGADSQKTDFYPEGTRAIQLYDSAVVSYFLKSFGRNQREITCECQRSDEPSMVQVLHISNGDTINQKLESKNNWLTELLENVDCDVDAIELAFIRVLSRHPQKAETDGILQSFGDYEPSQRRLLFEDLLWGLMSSREFLFNH